MKRLALVALIASCPKPGADSYFARSGRTSPPVIPLSTEQTFLVACRGPIAHARALGGALLGVKGVRAVDNTFEPYNEIERALDNSAEWAHLMTQVAPDDKIREAARTCEREVHDQLGAIQLDRRFYDAIRAVDISLADADTKRFASTTLRDLKRAGVELDDTARARMKQIDARIAQLGQAFAKNIADDTRHIEVKDRARLAGMPADWIASHPADPSTGAISITTDHADYVPFITYATDDELRKELFQLFRSRGDTHNEEVLREILQLRAEKAALLGFATWADYESDDKMLRGGKAAADFLEHINQLARPRAKKDYVELFMKLRTIDKKATEVGEWQVAWLENQVKRDSYAVDSAEVRKYFPYDQTFAGLLALTSTIYDLQYKRVTDPRAWTADVQVFDLMRGTERLGRVFFDMHPRPNKYKHAAAFPITTGVKGVQLPEAALVCNLPANHALLDHADVVTMFHELHHVLHHILGGKQHWVVQSGMATELDFIEAPSQVFEEWAWSYEVLARFAKHYQTGEVIPKELVEKMRRADHFARGTWAVQQLLFAAIALRFHQDDPAKLDQLAVVKQLQKKYTPFAFVEGTKFHTSFTHLVEYSSMYYTYMWSLVIAKDLLGELDHKLLATDATTAFRDKVLVPGGSKDAAELVRDFLGRPSSFKAFEKYLSD